MMYDSGTETQSARPLKQELERSGFGSLKKRISGSICGNLTTETGAHEFNRRRDANTAKIKPVGIPTSANSRVVTQPAVCVPCAGVVQKLEVLVSEIEQYAALTGGVGSPASTMGVVPAIMVSPRIVKHREQTNDFLNRTALGSDEQAVALDSAPMRGSVDRISVALKLSRDNFPNALPIRVHC